MARAQSDPLSITPDSRWQGAAVTLLAGPGVQGPFTPVPVRRLGAQSRHAHEPELTILAVDGHENPTLEQVAFTIR